MSVFDDAAADIFVDPDISVAVTFFMPGAAVSYGLRGIRETNVELYSEQTGTIERRTVWSLLFADLPRTPVAGDQIYSSYGLETVKGILPAGDDGIVVKVVVG